MGVGVKREHIAIRAQFPVSVIASIICLEKGLRTDTMITAVAEGMVKEFAIIITIGAKVAPDPTAVEPNNVVTIEIVKNVISEMCW